MLLSLENEQKIYRSNARLHIFLIQNEFYISFQTFSIAVNDLPCDSNLHFIVDWHNSIVNNGNILTDRTDKRKYLQKKYIEL